jgi:hypothetical protein
MIKLYKRRHSPQCLADIDKRIAQGKLKPPSRRSAFLANYARCSYKWWARGTNKFGQPIPRQSTGCDLLADAELVKLTLYETDLRTGQPAAPVLTLQQALEKWDVRKLKGTPDNPRPETTRIRIRRGGGISRRQCWRN